MKKDANKAPESSPRLARGEEMLRKLLEEAIAAPLDFDYDRLGSFGEWKDFPAQDQKLCLMDQNDLGNAARLIDRYGKNLIFIAESGWYAWTGKYWSRDEGEKILQLCAQKTVKKMKGEIFARVAKGQHDGISPKEIKELFKIYCRFRISSGNTNRIAAIGIEARPHLTRSKDDLDTHHFLLNVQNGTLNLKAQDTGEENFDGIVLEKHQRQYRITKLANVLYDPNAEAPVFHKFIREVVPDDEVRIFLQRFFGYCLTGSTKEQAILMLWGEGSNGKSTLVDLLNWLLGDYALVTPFASLLHTDQRRGGEPTPDLARMPGARLVSAAEPETGARFAESMLKQLTGGEKMTVRHLRQDFFEFKPQFKLCLSFNNKPYIRGQDEGIWRRLLLVPFNQRFVDADRLKENPGALPKIKDLDKKLHAEAPGILNWLLDGYRMWAERGLDIPATVRAATEEYRHESNPVHQFVQGWCDRAPGTMIAASRLYEAYQLWCKENAMDAVKQTSFGRRMSEMNVERETIQVVYYRGLQLNAAAEDKVREEENRRQRRGMNTGEQEREDAS